MQYNTVDHLFKSDIYYYTYLRVHARVRVYKGGCRTESCIFLLFSIFPVSLSLSHSVRPTHIKSKCVSFSARTRSIHLNFMRIRMAIDIVVHNIIIRMYIETSIDDGPGASKAIRSPWLFRPPRILRAAAAVYVQPDRVQVVYVRCILLRARSLVFICRGPNPPVLSTPHPIVIYRIKTIEIIQVHNYNNNNIDRAHAEKKK